MKYAAFKILAILSAIVVVSPARAAHSDSSDTYYDKARVLAVDPIYTTVSVSTPRRECRQVPVANHGRGHGGKHYKSATPIIFGGVVGAAIGNQFGHGTGKTVGTIAGGILGGSVARDVQHRYGNHGQRGHGRGHQKTVTQCETIDEYHNEERIDGYQVKYRYNGRVYHTRTETDPGKRMQVQVSVAPAEY
jgi:uncharacterized protein YcfJ